MAVRGVGQRPQVGIENKIGRERTVAEPVHRDDAIGIGRYRSVDPAYDSGELHLDDAGDSGRRRQQGKRNNPSRFHVLISSSV
jgi:hypothetical protein